MKITDRFTGQYKQDQYIYETFFKDRVSPGIFIEVGADDGLRFSNTLFFEKFLNWNGVCIEPKPTIFGALLEHRNSLCIQCAISQEDNSEAEFLEIEGYGRQLSGIVNNYDDQHILRIENESNNPLLIRKNLIIVKCRRLDSIINELGFERVNFLSIDTEGAEISVLKSLGDVINQVDVILIENNYHKNYADEFSPLGKEFILHKTIKHDEIWVNKYFPDYAPSSAGL